jgi:hypothetical protein
MPISRLNQFEELVSPKFRFNTILLGLNLILALSVFAAQSDYPSVTVSRFKRFIGAATGLDQIDKHITRQMEQLPGFTALNAVNDKIASILALETPSA